MAAHPEFRIRRKPAYTKSQSFRYETKIFPEIERMAAVALVQNRSDRGAGVSVLLRRLLRPDVVAYFRGNERRTLDRLLRLGQDRAVQRLAYSGQSRGGAAEKTVRHLPETQKTGMPEPMLPAETDPEKGKSDTHVKAGE